MMISTRSDDVKDLYLILTHFLCVQGDVVFSVQEYMSGGSLDRHLWDTPLLSVPWARKLQWAFDTAEGMHVIHTRGFTHR